ncbi:MAG: diaminopimelate epimerase [Magnetococcales bacterium]|nr:diaminopimelate epimerase [Magnetococcales bacterium]
MELSFTKMHGLGNDFVLLDHLEAEVAVTPELAAFLADRRLGVGCDQLVQLLAPSGGGTVEMRIYNADGSQAEMCGNAARCVARYLWDYRGVEGKEIILETLAGLITTRLTESGLVAVDMGVPSHGEAKASLQVGGLGIAMTEVSMGNPHCVIFADDVPGFSLEERGLEISEHPHFPHRTNVELVERLDQHTLGMRVWERGVGITPACGTGACAAVVAAVVNGLTERQVTVRLDGGDLDIHWQADGHVIMTGPAQEVFQGSLVIIPRKSS